MNTKRLVQTALFIGLEVVISRFLSISTLTAKISFGFIPIAIIAMLYGPIYSGATAVIADIIGAVLFPIGPFFPGFTVSALLRGLTYGSLLYKKPTSVPRISLAVSVICLLINLVLGTFWISIISGKALIVLLPPRILINLTMIPLQIIVILATGKLLEKRFALELA